MKIKVNKHKLNIHYRGSPAPWGSWTQQHAYCLRYAHSHHIESHLGKKQPQAKIAIAFLFGQLHFNNVTSHALFYGGHLIMRSKKCAMQNQGITLNFWTFRVSACSRPGAYTFCCSLRENTKSFAWNVDQWCEDTFISAYVRTFPHKSEYKRINVWLIHPKVFQECSWIANSVNKC